MENFKEALQWCRDINGVGLYTYTFEWVEQFIPLIEVSPRMAPPLRGWGEFSEFLEVWGSTTPSEQVRVGVGRMVSQLFCLYGYDLVTNRPVTTKEALKERISAQFNGAGFTEYSIMSIYNTLVNVITDLCDVASLNGFSFYDVFENRGFDPALLHSVLGTTPAQIGQPTAATGQPTAEQTVTATASTKGRPRNVYTERLRTHMVYELMKRVGIKLRTYDKTDIARFIRAAIGGNTSTEIRDSNIYKKHLLDDPTPQEEAIISALFEPFDKKQTSDK